MLDAAGHPLDRGHWRVAYVSSAQAINPAEAAIDGRADTFWHSRYSPAPIPPYPHLLVIDLGAVTHVSGFRYLPRPQNLPV